MYLIKRDGYFHIEYFDESNGRTRRKSTRTKYKKEAMQFLVNFKLSNKDCQTQRTRISLDEFYLQYADFAKANFSVKYIRSIDLSFRKLMQYFNCNDISKIDKRTVENFLIAVFKNASFSSRLYLRTLKAAFNKAKDWGYLGVNPFVGIRLPKPQRNIPKFISIEQFDGLLQFESDAQLKRLYKLAFHTGLRLSELSYLKWKNIHFEEKNLYVRNSQEFTTKSKNERVVPLNTTSLTSLYEQKSLMRISPNFVFCNDTGNRLLQDHISKRFKRCLRYSGLDGKIHFHTLRHSFASNLAQRGVSLFQIKNLLGHSSITTTEIYSHISDQSLRDAVDKL